MFQYQRVQRSQIMFFKFGQHEFWIQSGPMLYPCSGSPESPHGLQPLLVQHSCSSIAATLARMST